MESVGNKQERISLQYDNYVFTILNEKTYQLTTTINKSGYTLKLQHEYPMPELNGRTVESFMYRKSLMMTLNDGSTLQHYFVEEAADINDGGLTVNNIRAFKGRIDLSGDREQMMTRKWNTHLYTVLGDYYGEAKLTLAVKNGAVTVTDGHEEMIVSPASENRKLLAILPTHGTNLANLYDEWSDIAILYATEGRYDVINLTPKDAEDYKDQLKHKHKLIICRDYELAMDALTTRINSLASDLVSGGFNVKESLNVIKENIKENVNNHWGGSVTKVKEEALPLIRQLTTAIDVHTGASDDVGVFIELTNHAKTLQTDYYKTYAILGTLAIAGVLVLAGGFIPIALLAPLELSLILGIEVFAVLGIFSAIGAGLAFNEVHSIATLRARTSHAVNGLNPNYVAEPVEKDNVPLLQGLRDKLPTVSITFGSVTA